MDSSVNSHSRKRKYCSSLIPSNGRFTCSKSQMHVHSSRLGRTLPDPPARVSVNGARLLTGKPLGKRRNVDQILPVNGSSLDLSIKDLRARARRIFSSASVVEEKSRKFEVGIRFAEEGFNGFSKVVDNCEILNLEGVDSDPGVKNSDMDSELGFACSDKEEQGNRENAGSLPEDVDPVLDLGSQGQPDKEEHVNLTERTPVMKKNEFESGKDCSKTKSNCFNSGSRSVLNSSCKRKVFKAPSSFSYRRLLPFLMEMTKDDSSLSKIDVFDTCYPCEVQNLNKVTGKCIHSEDPFAHTKTLVEGDNQNSQVQLKGQDLDDAAEMSKTGGNVGLSGVEQTYHESGTNGVDETEEFVQTTPPDDTIFHKHDNKNSGVSRELHALKSGNQILQKPSNGNSAVNNICISLKSHPARNSSTTSNAKLVLNPCSRSKIFESSSFSYRRLLPFLTDVAKSTTNIEEHPKYQRKECHTHSVTKESVDEHFPVNRSTRDDCHDSQDAEVQEPFPSPVNLPISGSSDDVSPHMSTPRLSSGDTACSEAIAKPDVLLSEGALQYEQVTLYSSEKVEAELLANGIQSCPSESNCSSEKSCSTMNQESFTRESKSDSLEELEKEILSNSENCSEICSAEKSCSPINQEAMTGESKPEVLQVPEHETTDIGKECMALGKDYHKDKLQLIKGVSLYQSSLEIKEFGHQGIQGNSPSKGILKRNPRGCRGLCNCLNCSSFRLHAERSFEFSKNQMLDAEEVAQGLIHELAELRNLVEKSVFGGNDLVGTQVNQAKEACKRALEKEQLAKTRLSQMIDDLNIHCRTRPLQRPRVTFSRYIKEINTRKTDLLGSPDLQRQYEKTK